MIRESSHSGEFEARRDKALRLLYLNQEAARKAEEKERLKAEKLSAKTVDELPKSARGRSILQLDDSGNILMSMTQLRRLPAKLALVQRA